MNLYATLDDVKTRLGLTGTTDDAVLLVMLEAASRDLDAACNRHFYCESGTRYFDTGPLADRLLIDDVLSISAFAVDSESDGTFDGETWTQGDANDYILWPFNSFPKIQVLVAPDGDYSFATDAQKYVKATGLWGYGDGRSATPYESSGVTVTVADAVATTVTVSADDVIEPGHTILAGTEQMFVSAVATGSFTAERGVNGTTAAAQSAAAASIYRYPKLLEQAALSVAMDLFNTQDSVGLSSERIGDYSYQRLTNRGETLITEIVARLINPLRKVTVA